MGRTNREPGGKLVSYSDGLASLVDKLLDVKFVKVGTFWEFIRDIWSLGYEKKSYFDAWHVGYICNELERALAEDKYFMAVLPRMHLKSTILGHGFSVWHLLKQPSDASLLYLSYNAKMSQYHIKEAKNAIRRNPVLNPIMTDRSNDADYSFRYQIGRRQIQIEHGGLYAFKRGMHTGAMVADDLLKDPQNPLTPDQVYKIEEHFKTESMFIPNKGCPIVVLGTPMLPDDLLAKLKEDERFNSVILPALDPLPGKRVLFPELYSEEDLLKIKKSSPSSFETEFLLAPRLSTDSYFSEAEITSCEDVNLRNYDPDSEDLQEEIKKYDYVVAGFDIGKKKHPSHIVVFGKKEEKFYQLYSRFMDQWLYDNQAEHLNKIAEKFHVTRGYYDNTKAELEDRGLNRVWRPITFTLKSKFQMASAFDHYVHSGMFFIIEDSRQKSQITCVNRDLQAAETPAGHGDSFFSCALACLALKELDTKSITDLGDMNFFIESSETKPISSVYGSQAFDKPKENKISCPTCHQHIGYDVESGICIICKSNKMEAQLNKLIMNRGN